MISTGNTDSIHMKIAIRIVIIIPIPRFKNYLKKPKQSFHKNKYDDSMKNFGMGDINNVSINDNNKRLITLNIKNTVPYLSTDTELLKKIIIKIMTINSNRSTLDNSIQSTNTKITIYRKTKIRSNQT